MPNEQIRTFLEALLADKPHHLYVLLWTLATKRSHWFQNVEEAIQRATLSSALGLYVGVGLSSRDYGPSRRCISDQVAGLVALWADLDLRSDAHPKQALPATLEAALTILPTELPPSFIISTGNGAHVWWLFKEPWIFEDDGERKQAATLASRWQSLLKFNAASRGWAFDRLADPARVLRVPGSHNCKNPRDPKPVEIHTQTDHRYNPSDLATYLDDHAIPESGEQERAAKAWEEKIADKDLAIDPSVTVPAESLERWIAADPRFEKTWVRQRADLSDQSQSGYDLALANFAAENGLSEQQAVDLIIHHRRIHGQRPRTRTDYFQRTIAKAYLRSDTAHASKDSAAAVMLMSEPPNAASDTAGEEGPEAKPDPATQRAILCDRVSAVLGVRILRIVKVTGKDPTYQMELESSTVHFSNISKLIDQRSFRSAIASSADRFIANLKPKAWEKLVQIMLDALTIADGGDDTDVAGAARIYLEQYLSDTPFIDTIEHQPIQTARKPAVVDGQITICSTDLQQYVNKSFGKNLAIAEVASMLIALGTRSRRVKCGRLRDQSRWFLPVEEFAPGDYAAGQENGGARAL